MGLTHARKETYRGTGDIHVFQHLVAADHGALARRPGETLREYGRIWFVNGKLRTISNRENRLEDKD